MNRIKELEFKLIENGIAKRGDIRGCSIREIEKLEKYFEIKLPISYKDFLFRMGHQAGSFYRGTDIFYEDIFDNREVLVEILTDDGCDFKLPASAFVFSCHQGYIFHFFDVKDDSIDPPIYGYKEDELQIKKINSSFTNFLFDRFIEVCEL